MPAPTQPCGGLRAYRPGPLAAIAGLALLAATAGAARAQTPAQTLAQDKDGGAPIVVAAAKDETRIPFLSYVRSPLGDYLAGLIAQNRDDLYAAAEFMLRALKADPENPGLLKNAFTLVAAEGRHAEAVRLARRVIALDPKDSTANLVLTVDAIERGDLAAAADRLGAMPGHGLAIMTRPLLASWIALETDGIEAATAALHPLGETRGLAALYNLHLGLLNDRAGRTEASDTALAAALEAAPSRSLRFTWLIGNYYERQGKPAEARKVYREYLDGGGDVTLLRSALARTAEGRGGPAPVASLRSSKAGVAEALFNLASLLSQERAEQTALVYLQLALRLRPAFAMAQILHGEILQSQDRGKQSIETYRKIDPASPFAWTARMRIADELDRLERSEEAIAELEALAGERPDEFQPLFRMANIMRAKERFADAVVAYDRASERLGDIEPRHWTFFYFRGIALERSKDWPRAEADFLKALDLEPEQPYVMNYLAYSWVEQKAHLDEAQDMLIRAVELRPNDGFIVDSLGWVYYRLENFEKAVEYLEKAVELRPQDPVINDHLGDAYWRVGREQEARFQWRRALSLEPEEDQVPTIEAKIEDGLEAEPENI